MNEKLGGYLFAGRNEESVRLEAQARVVQNIIEREFEIMQLKPNMKVLDAGCGTGAITRRIASKVLPAMVFGIDIDPLFIDKAKDAALKEGTKNVHFELGDINHLKYDDKMFDLAYCNLVLMHLKTPVRAVSELKRVVRKKGIVAALDVDDGAMIVYPPLPKFIDLWSKFTKRAEIKGMDRKIGRKLYSIFSEAGLNKIKIHPLPMSACQEDPDVLRGLMYQYVQILEQDKNALTKEDIVTERDYSDAMEEINAFVKHSGAFIMVSAFLALGET